MICGLVIIVSVTAMIVRSIPRRLFFTKQYIITGLFQFVEKPRYSAGGIGKIKVYQETRDFFALHGPNWKLDDAMVRGGKAYAKSLCSSLITVSLIRIESFRPGELGELLKHYADNFKGLVEPFTDRVRQEWPDVQIAAARERVAIASALTKSKMYGVSTYKLELYGCELFEGLTSMCVPEYLVDHFTRSWSDPTVDTSARMICLGDTFISRLDQMDALVLLGLRDKLDAGARLRIITPAVYAMMHRLLKEKGVMAADIVPVSDHYGVSLYMLDVNGSVYFASRPDNRSRATHASIIGVTYNGHFYPIAKCNQSLRKSIAHRLEAAVGRFKNQLASVVTETRARKAGVRIFLRRLPTSPRIL